MVSTQIDSPCEPYTSVADAASIALRWIDKGFNLEKVDDVTQKVRISLCESCEYFEPIERRCLECCCPMDFKTTLLYDPIKMGIMFKKTKIACPIGKW